MLEVPSDGWALIAIADRIFAGAGRTGGWTKADGLIHFEAEELR